MNFSIARRRVKGQFWQWALVAVVVLAAPASARADVLTYYPAASATGTNDLGDLDHHFYYAWTIGLISVPTGQSITSASITFQNLYNWDSNKNVLYLDLLDNAAAGGTVMQSTSGINSAGDSYTSVVRYANDPDVSAGSSSVTNFADAFDTTSGANANVLTGATNPKTDLTEHSFLPDALSPLNSADLASLRSVLTSSTASTSPMTLPGTYADIGGATQPYWSVTQEPGAAGVGKFDYTYTFTAAQLANLITYIGPSTNATRDITLALDPDCHFFNDGVSFTIVTQSFGVTAVPEPASLLLLGTGLVLGARQYRRKAGTKS